MSKRIRVTIPCENKRMMVEVAEAIQFGPDPEPPLAIVEKLLLTNEDDPGVTVVFEGATMKAVFDFLRPALWALTERSYEIFASEEPLQIRDPS